jgi:hypothetical protein
LVVRIVGRSARFVLCRSGGLAQGNWAESQRKSGLEDSAYKVIPALGTGDVPNARPDTRKITRSNQCRYMCNRSSIDSCLIYVWASSDSPAPLLALVAVTLVAHTVVRFLPVRCSISGCRGLMVKKRTRISGDKARLIYRCSICGSAYATRVFYPTPSGNYDPDRWG